MAKALVFAPKHNAPGKKDASGAFIPEAKAFLRALSLDGAVKLFDNTLARPFDKRRSDCEQWLDESSLLGIVAFFCHGWKDGIQAGWKKGSVHRLADTLRHACAPNPLILLYACDAGRDADNDRDDDVQTGPGGEGGFADMLRDECRKAGLRATIYAHTKEGHCTWNPHVRVFLPDETAGGRWVVDPKSELWGAWVRALRHTDMRFRFPFLPPDDLVSELRAAGPA
jgi:hypothetical protein